MSILSNAQNTSYSLLADTPTEQNYNLIMSVPKVKEELILNNMNYTINMSSSHNNGSELAVGLLAAGAAFIIGGLTTQAAYEGYNGTNKPFFKQGPRMVAIMGGSVMLTSGLVIMIGK